MSFCTSFICGSDSIAWKKLTLKNVSYSRSIKILLIFTPTDIPYRKTENANTFVTVSGQMVVLMCSIYVVDPRFSLKCNVDIGICDLFLEYIRGVLESFDDF